MSQIKNDLIYFDAESAKNKIIKFRSKYKKISFSLAQNQGDLLIMSGQTQSFWKHEIKKEKKVLLPRVNLTFRNIIG